MIEQEYNQDDLHIVRLLMNTDLLAEIKKKRHRSHEDFRAYMLAVALREDVAQASTGNLKESMAVGIQEFKKLITDLNYLRDEGGLGF